MHWPSILLYMISSFMIVIFNKIILTQYHFPSVPFLMLCQSLTGTIFFWTKLKQKVTRELLLVCLLNVANVFFGLNATGTLNIAMFTAMRRISVLMTLIAQWWFLQKKTSTTIIVIVGVMVFGSFVAAANDLTFDLIGYIFVTMNNLLTAAAQIASKYAFDKGWEKETVLFYSSLTSVVISGIKCYDFDLNTFHDWDQTGFQIAFVFSITLGIMLNFGASWVIEKNDALTLAVAGSTKSAVMGLVVCLGLFDPTYVFTWVNFIGLQISTIGSFVYVYYTKANPKYTPVPTKEEQMTPV